MTKKSSAVKKAVKRSAGKSKPKPAKKTTKKQTSKTVVKLSNKKLNELLTRARELQWAGQHEKTIEVCTQALDAIGKGNSNTAQIQMDLLDTRAESNVALLQNDTVKKDARLMMRIANATPSSQKRKKAGLKTQALIWKGRGYVVDIKFDLAISIFSNALKIARQGENKHLEAESLYWLGSVQRGEQQLKTGYEALEMLKALGDQHGLARILWGVAAVQANAGQTKEAQQNAQTALKISEQLGYNRQRGRALSVLALLETDVAQAITLSKQAHQAYEASGYSGEIAHSYNSFGYRYSLLGLYSRALRNYKKGIEILPPDSGIVQRSNIIHIEIEIGHLEKAGQHLTELHSMEMWDSIKGFTEQLAGRLALLKGKHKEAIKHIKKAIRISQEFEHASEVGELALLGEAYLAGGKIASALKATKRAVKKHRELDFPFIDDHPSQNIWWRHVQALRANKKYKEADEALEMAYDLLLKGIESLRDDGLRRNYLNKVKINREIVQAWDKHAAKNKLPRERRFAHLEVESSLREPFEQLAEISLELNVLHSLEEIQTFLVEEATELSGGERVLLILEKDGELELADSYVPVGRDAKKTLASIKRHISPARHTRTVKLTRPMGKGLSRIVAPLIAQNQVIGYLYTDMDSLYGKFDDTDRDMLGMLANQGAVALDNAGLLEGLERKVDERTEQLNQRVDELAILNSVGEAMAKTLDVKTVTRIVGDKVRDIFNAELTTIFLFDDQTRLFHHQYYYDKTLGKHLHNIEPYPFGKGLASQIIKTGQSLLLYTAEELADHGVVLLTMIDDKYKDIYKNVKDDYVNSYLGVPINISGKSIGVVSISGNRAYAFTESDKSLLETLAFNMGVAIQNARLFEAEQERNAELAIINSVQEGLAKQLDFQKIIELVGEKVGEIFKADTAAIAMYNSERDWLTDRYYVDRGERIPFPDEPTKRPSLTAVILDTHKPLLIGNKEEANKLGAIRTPRRGKKVDKNESFLGVPILAGKKNIGLISVQSYQQQAYD
ncbi:MAG TPA: GAF domain-containing protein, partial [Anaerolineales bacterium]|nr:GAF domain-containing protein [Anaerolineales bacterium]